MGKRSSGQYKPGSRTHKAGYTGKSGWAAWQERRKANVSEHRKAVVAVPVTKVVLPGSRVRESGKTEKATPEKTQRPAKTPTDKVTESPTDRVTEFPTDSVTESPVTGKVVRAIASGKVTESSLAKRAVRPGRVCRKKTFEEAVLRQDKGRRTSRPVCIVARVRRHFPFRRAT